jgi:hypothetical protein
MTELSGWVAILSAPGAGAQIIETRDLGLKPVAVKPGLVIPVVEQKPALSAGQEYGKPTIAHDGVTATRTWPVQAAKTPAELDQDALNAELLADGSIVRGLALYVFGLAKGTIPVNSALTKVQFAAAIRALMR